MRDSISSSRATVRRFFLGFVVGVAICIAYWSFGFIPRDVWFGSSVTAMLIIGKTWVWPTAVFGVVFREVELGIAVLAMYSLNGLCYGLVSSTLFLLKKKPYAYLLLSAVLVAALVGFNASVMESFSWFWLFLLLAAFGTVAAVDLRK